MDIVKTSIKRTMSAYEGRTPRSRKENPLAAVFALKAQQNYIKNDEMDVDIEADMKEGKLNYESQMKLVMKIKDQFQMEVQKKQIMRAMGSAFRTIAEQRVEMIDIADEIESIIESDINEKRARKNVFYEKCLAFSTS